MVIGMDRTPKGRIWACWVGGGDNQDGFFVAATSNDDGKTWQGGLLLDEHLQGLLSRRVPGAGRPHLHPL